MRSGLVLQSEFNGVCVSWNPRRVGFRRRRHLGCHHHHRRRYGWPRRHHCRGCRHRNFGSVRNTNVTAPGSSELAESTSGARNMSSVLNTSAKPADCTSEPAADYRNAAAKNRHCCHGTTTYRDSCAAEVRRNGRCSNSSDERYCCSAVHCAGRRYSHRNRNGQSTVDDPHGTCGRIARAGSPGDSIHRILTARGHGPSCRAELPRCAGYFRDAEEHCCPSSSSVCAASFQARRAAGFARIRAEAHCCLSSSSACAGSFLSRRAAGLARDRAAAERFRLHREKRPGGRCLQRRRGPEHPDRRDDRSSRRHLPDD